MSTESLILWKHSKETKEILNELRGEIDIAKDDITRGSLIRSTALEREYCHAIGYLKGLRFLEDLLKDEGDHE